ncbi:MAG: ABC transporter substrate-binding protein, partial [Ensifer adhaerens]
MKTARTLLALAGVAYGALSLGATAQAAELRMAWWGGDSRHVATQKATAACGQKYGHTVKG